MDPTLVSHRHLAPGRLGIWSAAEAFHLPWTKPGITDLGPSVGYICASLALYFAAAGAEWSLDALLWRTKFGSKLTSPSVQG